MKVKELMECITEVAPLEWQEDYDNAGLQVGDWDAETKKALIALDVTEAVLDEAIAKSCDLVVSHHPLLFQGLKQLTHQTAVERCVIKAVKHDLSIVSMHTNLDNSYLGVSCMLAKRLGLNNLRLLAPSPVDTECCGAGMMGEFEAPMEEIDFLELVAGQLDLPCVRHSALTGHQVRTVGLCGGSGSPFLHDALRNQVDAYLTADLKYHTFFAPDGLLLVDGGHFETEQFTKVLIKELIQKKFPNFAAEIAETNTNAVHYFCKKS